MEKVKLGNYDNNRKVFLKKCIVAASFVSNLGILFYFKYFNFVIDILNSVLYRTRIELNVPNFDVILPVGISFYTFQALSYTMDVYRDEIYAEKNFFRYALFVSFFPQLVAGPIERSKNLLKQLAIPQKFNYVKVREGLLLILWGYFLKIVIADRIAIFVDTVYGDCSTYGGWYLIIATILFAFQIYCDFSGYSTIAMGTAKTFGIDLMENFDAPYLEMSISGFWRKWHISLTSWFKDYLYIPLGGSRRGQCRKYINKIIVFVVSGLWHGASLTFVLWGGINGLYQIIEEVLQPIKDKLINLLKLNRDSLGYKIVSVLITFFLIDFSWVFFRADNIVEVIKIIESIYNANNPWVLFDGSLYECGLDIKNWWLMISTIGLLVIADLCKKRGICIRRVVEKEDYWFRWIIIAVAVTAILTFGIWGPSYNEANFLYFQF